MSDPHASSFEIPAAALTELARQRPRSTGVWSHRAAGRRIWIKRTGGIATWLGALQAFVFIALARLLSGGLTPSLPIEQLGGSLEAGRLRWYRRIGLAVPRLLGVAPRVIAIDDAGLPLKSELDEQTESAMRERIVCEAMDDLIALHRAGHWHGGAQLRNVTRFAGRLHRIDFEQPYGGRLPTALLQVCDVFMLLSSAIRYLETPALERLAWRWLQALGDEERYLAWRRVLSVLKGLARFPPLRLLRYEHRRLAAAAQAYSFAWQQAITAGRVDEHPPLALRWRVVACVMALMLVADDAHEFIYDHDDPPTHYEQIDLEA